MYIVVFVTVKDLNEAEKIASQLLEDRLIACANISEDVKSIFSWKGQMERSNEVLLILKSLESCLPEIVKTVKRLHSYETPEIIALPILDGSADYLNWILESCRAPEEK